MSRRSVSVFHLSSMTEYSLRCFHWCSGTLPFHTHRVTVVPKLLESLRPSASYVNSTSLLSGRTTFAREPSAFHRYLQRSFLPSSHFPVPR